MGRPIDAAFVETKEELKLLIDDIKNNIESIRKGLNKVYNSVKNDKTDLIPDWLK